MLACIAAFALAVHADVSSFAGASQHLGRKLTEISINVPVKAIKDAWIYAIYPPSAATQRNMKSEILFLPLDAEGKPGPAINSSEVLTRFELDFISGQSRQPGVLFRIRATKPEHSLRYGFKLLIRAEADMYVTNGYVQDYPATDASQFVGESLACDLSNMRDFLNPVVQSGLTADDTDLDLFVISRLGIIKYSTQLKPVIPASKVINTRSGDCGGKSMGLQGQYRVVGVPARIAMGYFGKNGGALIPHAWVEAARGGHWTPIEASNLDVATKPGRSIGRPEASFIMHFESGLAVSYKDPTGQQINSIVPSMQTPHVMGRCFNGEPVTSPNRPQIRQYAVN